VRNALKQKELTVENVQLKEKITELAGVTDMIGESEGMKRV